MKAQKKRPDIVSVHLSPESKAELDRACHERGMTIKSLLGRLIVWFNALSKTEQSIVLGQIEHSDLQVMADLLVRRRPGPGARRKPARKRARR